MRHKLNIGRHHFAFLRSIANGLDVSYCAKRFLGVEHGNEVASVSRNTINAVRAIAKRHNQKSSYRLIGLVIRPKTDSVKISIDEYISENDLQDWSESEVIEMFKEAYPDSNESVNKHREDLRLKQIELLDSLERLSVQPVKDSDLVSGWFDDALADKLITSGILTVYDLKKLISIGGNWYKNLPGVGSSKADNVKSFLESITEPLPCPISFELSSGSSEFFVASNDIPASQDRRQSSLNAKDDPQALDAWIRASAGSSKTETVYRREGIRLLLWMQTESSIKSFDAMKVENCLDYMTFLQHIPDSWISRRHVKPFESGWAPFRGQLSHDSQKQTIVIVAALFNFLQAANYIHSNPWVLVNQKTGDDSNKIVKQSRAISEFGLSEILRYIEAQPITTQSERIRFIFKFLESVGLRSMEFLNAKLGHFEEQPEGLVLYVNGKGAKNRYVYIPNQARDALERYFGIRGMTIDSDSELPLLASVHDSNNPVGYQAFYQHVKSWVLRAIRESDLSDKEKNKLVAFSPHWLRHTFGTTAILREVPMDAIQAQMGHASIQTTMNIYGRAPLKRRAEELGKAFS